MSILRKLRRALPLFLITLLLLLSAGVLAQSDAQPGAPVPPDLPRIGERLDPSSVTIDMDALRQRPAGVAALSSDLYDLFTAWTASPAQGMELADERGLDLSGDRVAVMFIMVDSAAADAAIPAIEAAGGTITARYDRWIDALVPVLALDTLAQLPGVSQLRRIIEVFPLDEDASPRTDANPAPASERSQTGTYLTQGVAASNASAWHSAGITGSGITVAVFDSFKNYLTAQSLGELPPGARLTTYVSIDTTSSEHGTAVAEVVYDMAPGVNLILTSPTSVTNMAQRITDLANLPVGSRPRIITSSIGYLNAEPGDGTGAVSQAINYAVSQGVFFTQAAGNQALGNYGGTFNDTDGDGWHNFSGVNEINFLNDGFQVPAGYPISIVLRWNDWPVSDQDYDLYLFQCTTSCSIIASSENGQSGSQPPTEEIYGGAPATSYYGYAIAKYSATDNVVLDVMGYNLPDTLYRMADHSLIDAASGMNVFGVAALDVNDPYLLEDYSSQGPAMGLGGTLGTGNAQPRIGGFANVHTWAYDTLGYSFNGTSSATPHVAGAAALILQANPSYTPSDVKAFLEGRAVDMGAGGYDYVYGAGRLWLGSPPATATPTLIAPIGATTDATPTFTWTSVGGNAWYYLWVDGAGGHVLDQWYDGGLECSGATCSVTPDIALAGGTYQWYVQAWTSSGGYGTWSNAASFDLPVQVAIPVAPTGGSPETQPAFTWVGTTEVSWYYLWIEGPNGHVLDQWYDGWNICTGGVCSVTPVSLVGGTYQYWVQMWTAGNGYHPWTSGTLFSVQQPPAAPTQIEPTGTLNTGNPTFFWYPVPAGAWYYIWVSGPSGHVLDHWYPASSCPGGLCSVTPSLNLPNGAYPWWIQAWSNEGGYGTWSSGMSFTVNAASPGTGEEPPVVVPPVAVPPEEVLPEQPPAPEGAGG